MTDIYWAYKLEYKNHKRQQNGTFLLVCVAVSAIFLILFPVSEIVVKVTSASTAIIPNKTKEKNKTGVNSLVSNNNLIANKNLIYKQMDCQ